MKLFLLLEGEKGLKWVDRTLALGSPNQKYPGPEGFLGLTDLTIVTKIIIK